MSNSPALHFHGSAAIAGTSIFDPLDLDIAAGKWTCLLGAWQGWAIILIMLDPSKQAMVNRLLAALA